MLFNTLCPLRVLCASVVSCHVPDVQLNIDISRAGLKSRSRPPATAGGTDIEFIQLADRYFSVALLPDSIKASFCLSVS
jgi:hypothetical protein